MRIHIGAFCIEAVASGCLLLAGSTVSSGDETSGFTSAAASIPNMACKPLPARQEPTPPEEWNDCVGAFTFQNGNSYRGEFRHGMRTGVGVLMINYIGPSDYSVIGSNEPAIYVGNFSDSRLNGYGLLFRKSGAAYAGTFKDNIAQSDLTQKECSGKLSANWTDCIGTYRFSNGNVYRGELARGLPDGIGMLRVEATGNSDPTQVRLPEPGIYIGRFEAGKLSGEGVVVMPDAGYFGTFSDNMFKPDKSESSEPPVR